MTAPAEPDEPSGELAPKAGGRGGPSPVGPNPLFEIVSAEFSADIYHGPLPPPHYVEAYKKAGAKDVGERFVRIAERAADHRMQMDREEAAHRREMEKVRLQSTTDANTADRTREQTNRWIGLLAVGMCVLLSGFLGSYCGSPAAGAAVACGVLVSIASVFIFGSRTPPPTESNQSAGTSSGSISRTPDRP